jgi:penicillin-insensitive murein endopeptidase
VLLRSIALAALALSACAEPRTEAQVAPRTEATSPSGAEHPRAEPARSSDAPSAAPERVEAPPDPIAALLALAGAVSTSIGGPNDGRVQGAVALPELGPGFRSNPRRTNATALYGTVELVQALVHAARVVHEAMPGSELVINDLGLPEGGPIPRHGSHRAGRDVDVLFYLVDREGQPMPSVGAFLDPRGEGYDFRDLADPSDDVLVRIDVRRTWRFVHALLEGPFGEDVQRIFVAEHLRALLLDEATRARAPDVVRARFAEITCQPGAPHDDHLHIRFFCSAEDIAQGCEDASPIYAWRRARLRELGVEPLVHRPRPDRPRSPTVSAEQARAAAGPMHARVEEWLARREGWLRPPRTGRPFCR